MHFLHFATGVDMMGWLDSWVLNAALAIMLFIVVFALAVAIRCSKQSYNLLVWAGFAAIFAVGWVIVWAATPMIESRYVAAALLPVAIILAAVGALRYVIKKNKHLPPAASGS